MSPADARVVQMLAELRRDWAQVVEHRRRAYSCEPSQGAPYAALAANRDHLDRAIRATESHVEELFTALEAGA